MGKRVVYIAHFVGRAILSAVVFALDYMRAKESHVHLRTTPEQTGRQRGDMPFN